MTDFVHLHVHSDFSLLDAAVSVESLAERAGKFGMNHLALTDHGNMFGAMEFTRACKKHSIKPIIGCEVYVSPGSRFEKKGTERNNRYYHLILLASNREGYLNLIKLCSFAYTEGFYYRPRIDGGLLSQYHGGLIALSACVSGEIPLLIQANKTGEAEKKALYYRDLFGSDEYGNPNFYLEIQDHGIPAEALKNTLSQKSINIAIAGIARRTGIPLVATNDVHYLDQGDSGAHDILLCIGTHKLKTDEKRKKYYGDQFYFKNGDDMANLFPDYPEAITNTVRIAKRCIVDIPEVITSDLPKFLPDFEIPQGFENATADGYLRHLAGEGIARRYPAEKDAGGEAWEKIEKQCEYELETIIRMGFTGYFLIVADFINWAKEKNIPVGPGRGSGAGSMVAYSLRITDIDPLKYNLLFERFLNPERISMPDFDVDFANEGRDDVINYVTEKYGNQRVGQIITFGTIGAKLAIKDVARALAISVSESDMITKLIPWDPKITLDKAINEEPKLQELEQDLRYAELFALAKKLEGLNRHQSIHAAGIVIGKTPLVDLVPLYQDTETKIIATQYSKNYLESCGLVKMDLLGVKTLDVIKKTEELIRRRGGEYAAFSVENAPEDDEATFRMLGEGKSFAVFQFESDGMQDILKRAKPGSIEDLIALISLYRPGPMDNIGQFIDSKNGRKAISYPDPSLEEALKETYGVIVYQEQVMQVARIVAGFSMGQADLLRRAMSKKDTEVLEKEKIPFIEGAVKQGYSREKADEIFELLVPFAGYGFNKSHAAAYSVIAYRTAYLKANFPAEFMSANMTNNINSADKEKLSQCIAEARKMELEIAPPDVNRSQKHFSVAGGNIVYGLLGIKGVGEGTADEIIKCRADMPYRDFMDFLDRLDIKTAGKACIEKLILAGAFDNLGTAREILFGNLERAVNYAQSKKNDKKHGQASLFGETCEKEYSDFKFDYFTEAEIIKKLKSEKELIGFYFSGHPLDEYKEYWEKLVKADLGNPAALAGSHTLIGLIKNLKIKTTIRGNKMASAVLEDYRGEIDIVFFPEPWEKCQNRIETGKVVILKGKIEFQNGKDKPVFNVNDCLNADEAERAVREEEIHARKWDKYRNLWKYAAELGLSIPDLASPGNIKSGNYTVLGVINSIKTHVDKKGNEMAFAILQDLYGEIDLCFYSRTWEKCKALVAVDEILALKGIVHLPNGKNGGKISFEVTSIHDINKLVRAAAKKAADFSKSVGPGAVVETPPEPKTKEEYREFHFRLIANANDSDLYNLRDFLGENPGQHPVFLHVPNKNTTNETIILSAFRVNAGIVSLLSNFSRFKSISAAWEIDGHIDDNFGGKNEEYETIRHDTISFTDVNANSNFYYPH